jgi:hypothetical protein
MSISCLVLITPRAFLQQLWYIKATVARFLVGKGPTKVRISTEGIDLYTALAFIERETDEWLNGKQGK